MQEILNWYECDDAQQISKALPEDSIRIGDEILLYASIGHMDGNVNVEDWNTEVSFVWDGEDKTFANVGNTCGIRITSLGVVWVGNFDYDNVCADIQLYNLSQEEECPNFLPIMCGGKTRITLTNCTVNINIVPIVAGENEVHIPNVECEEQKRTVLYSDGTLIINELPEDRRANARLHGTVVAEMDAYDPATNPYQFEVAIGYDPITEIEVVEMIGGRPWEDYSNDILYVSIGEEIAPTYMDGWFGQLPNLQGCDFANLDFAYVESATALFTSDSSLEWWYPAPRFSWIEPNLKYTNHMFNGCSSLDQISLCDFATYFSIGTIENCAYMFNGCTNVHTIFTPVSFPQTADGTNMFRGCENIESRLGTAYDPTEVGIEMAVIDTSSDRHGYLWLCGIE